MPTDLKKKETVARFSGCVRHLQGNLEVFKVVSGRLTYPSGFGAFQEGYQRSSKAYRDVFSEFRICFRRFEVFLKKMFRGYERRLKRIQSSMG